MDRSSGQRLTRSSTSWPDRPGMLMSSRITCGLGTLLETSKGFSSLARRHHFGLGVPRSECFPQQTEFRNIVVHNEHAEMLNGRLHGACPG